MKPRVLALGYMLVFRECSTLVFQPWEGATHQFLTSSSILKTSVHPYILGSLGYIGGYTIQVYRDYDKYDKQNHKDPY